MAEDLFSRIISGLRERFGLTDEEALCLWASLETTANRVSVALAATAQDSASPGRYLEAREFVLSLIAKMREA